MREILFRGWYEGDPDRSRGWAYGSLVKRQHQTFKNPCFIIEQENGEVFIVKAESVGQYCGRDYANGRSAFEGDLFYCDQYPFVRDGNINYNGLIEYVEHPSFMGWYYDLFPVSDRVRGSACGSGMPDLEGLDLIYVGNKYENPELLEKNK